MTSEILEILSSMWDKTVTGRGGGGCGDGTTRYRFYFDNVHSEVGLLRLLLGR